MTCDLVCITCGAIFYDVYYPRNGRCWECGDDHSLEDIDDDEET